MQQTLLILVDECRGLNTHVVRSTPNVPTRKVRRRSRWWLGAANLLPTRARKLG